MLAAIGDEHLPDSLGHAIPEVAVELHDLVAALWDVLHRQQFVEFGAVSQEMLINLI